MNKEKILNQYRSRKGNYTWAIYQPIPLPGYEETFQLSGRKCVDRMEFIKNWIERTYRDKCLRILDIGCNNGYFCFELAKLGHTVLGVDVEQKYIDTCNFVKGDDYPNLHFVKRNIDKDNIEEYSDYDLVLCFSVIHHFKDKIHFLNKLSRSCLNCLIEMDGKEYGKLELESHFFSLEDIGQVADPYGSGTRLRKTWACSNSRLRNLKKINYINGRGVFGDKECVIKREKDGISHTWLKTSLRHEKEIYERVADSRFFPRLQHYKEVDGFKCLQIEFIKNEGTPSIDEINAFYDYLKENKLFIADFEKDMFLFNKDNKIKVVDLESIFDISENNIYNFCKAVTQKIMKYDSYEKQIEALKSYHRL